jgi:hypothetical protein
MLTQHLYSHTDGTDKPLGRNVLGIGSWLNIYTGTLMEETNH